MYTILVHSGAAMPRKSNLRNITFSADAVLLDQARKKAEESHSTLNEAFRSWLEQFVRPAASGKEFDTIMNRLSHAVPGRKFTRDEMNER